MSFLIRAAALVVLTFGGAVTASAQSVSGTLADETTGRPLAGATIDLVDDGGQRVATSTTDRSGKWLVAAPADGRTYRVRVERVGYARIESAPFAIGATPVRLALETRPEVVMLEGITAQTLNYMALLNRSTTRKSARTLLPAEISARIERIRPRNTAELVRNLIATLGLTWDEWPHLGSVPVANGQIASRGLTFSGQGDFRSPWEQRGATSSRTACAAVVAVDGIPYVKNRLVHNLEQLIPLAEVRSVEIFPDPNFLPRELAFEDKLPKLDRPAPPAPPVPCGVVAIWTRDGLGIP